jgi:S-formylglutathione hydrolase FrmB
MLPIPAHPVGPPWRRSHAGRFEQGVVESAALRDNPLHDPWVRPIQVYVPPGYEVEPARHYPSVYVLQGFTGQLDMWWRRAAFRPTFPELVDALMSGDGAPPPAIVVFVDCWTSLGGSQFLDSPAIGRYHTHLCEEVVPWVDARYRTLASPAHRGISGHSSGGYGALVSCMLRPDLFGGLADHAGDALFENCYLPDFRRCARVLRDHYEGSYSAFWEDFRSRPAMSRDGDGELVNAWAMAAAYSADPDGTVRLPFDTATGELLPDVWERWLAWDPVRMAPSHAEALRGLRAIYLDAGRRDEWYLDLGTEAVRRALEGVGAREVCFELFEGGHTGVEYRYATGLRHLAERLARPPDP